MENENDSLTRLAHANGITDVEHEEQLRELARISAEVEQAKELQQMEDLPSADHSELDFPSIEDYGEDWEEYMLHGDPNWD